MHRDPLRLWIARNIQLIAFLGAYFVTVVAGNLIFASPLGRQSLAASASSDRFLQFEHTFTLGYWVLLLCPFLLTPLIVMTTRKVTGRWVGRVVQHLPEFGRLDYAIVAAACFGFVIYRFGLADVAALFASGVDATSSVQARFTIRERIGYSTLIPLQALLPFLTLYAAIRWIQSRERFWMVCAIVDTFVLSALLIMINMKWPVLLFYISLVLAILVYARKHPYFKTAVGGVFVFVAFLVVSSFVFRLAPADKTSPPLKPITSGQPARDPSTPSRPPAGATAAMSQASERIVATTTAASGHAPALLVIALNRMAISYPYYYQVFTKEGPVCGGILAQARRNPSCRPSKVVYARIFPNDGFENVGTSPLTVHVSGYALGGWPIAMAALVAGSVILGLFAALPLDHGPLSGTLTILGAVTGYHLSQIPGEGVVFYEHGLLWPALLMIGYGLWRLTRSTVRRRIAPWSATSRAIRGRAAARR